jgi:hypothetical protein
MPTPDDDGVDPRYWTALEAARELMDALPELEPTSALKQAASENGISFGEEMGAFVRWATAKLLES